MAVGELDRVELVDDDGRAGLDGQHPPAGAVDVLFTSIAELAGPSTAAVLLTGMGADGAQGLLKLRNCGAHTIAQDEATCVVYGMPRSLVEAGGADEVLPLDQIGARIRSFLGC